MCEMTSKWTSTNQVGIHNNECPQVLKYFCFTQVVLLLWQGRSKILKTYNQSFIITSGERKKISTVFLYGDPYTKKYTGMGIKNPERRRSKRVQVNLGPHHTQHEEKRTATWESGSITCKVLGNSAGAQEVGWQGQRRAQTWCRWAEGRSAGGAKSSGLSSLLVTILSVARAQWSGHPMYTVAVTWHRYSTAVLVELLAFLQALPKLLGFLVCQVGTHHLFCLP